MNAGPECIHYDDRGTKYTINLLGRQNTIEESVIFQIDCSN
jgi:hypothetical protein